MHYGPYCLLTNLSAQRLIDKIIGRVLSLTLSLKCQVLIWLDLLDEVPLITDARTKGINCEVTLTRKLFIIFKASLTVQLCCEHCFILYVSVSASLYLRQYLLFLVCSCVGTREEFFQSCESSAGLCYFFIGACPTKLLPIDFHLMYTHAHKYTYQSSVTQEASLAEWDSLFSNALLSSRPANQSAERWSSHACRRTTHPTENRPASGTKLTDWLYQWSACFCVASPLFSILFWLCLFCMCFIIFYQSQSVCVCVCTKLSPP